MAYEKNDAYKFYKFIGLKPRDSRKCHHPFRLKEKLVKALGEWMLKVMCGTHNDKLVRDFEDHLYVGKLTDEENNIVTIMAKSMIKPKRVLHLI